MKYQKFLQQINLAKSISELHDIAKKLEDFGISGFNLDEEDIGKFKKILSDLINEKLDFFLPSQL